MENMAKIVFDKIYDEFIFQDEEFVKLNSRINNMIKSIAEEHNGNLDDQQLESLKDSIVKIVSEAQRGGYRIGLKHACRLIFSIMKYF